MSELIFYNTLLTNIKQRIRQAQTKAIMTSNAEMISMYWDIGYMIRSAKEYGASILQQAVAKLPEQALHAGIRYVELNAPILMSQQLVGQLPWCHTISIISKCKVGNEALYYAQQTLQINWSRAVLAYKISKLTNE